MILTGTFFKGGFFTSSLSTGIVKDVDPFFSIASRCSLISFYSSAILSENFVSLEARVGFLLREAASDLSSIAVEYVLEPIGLIGRSSAEMVTITSSMGRSFERKT